MISYAIFINQYMGSGKFYILLEDSTYFQDLPKVSKGAKIKSRYNQVPHLTQNTNGKVTNSQ